MDIYCVAKIKGKPYQSVLKLINRNGIKWEWQCAEGSVAHFSIKQSVPYFYSPKRTFYIDRDEEGKNGWRELCRFEEGDLNEQ